MSHQQISILKFIKVPIKSPVASDKISNFPYLPPRFSGRLASLHGTEDLCPVLRHGALGAAGDLRQRREDQPQELGNFDPWDLVDFSMFSMLMITIV